MQFTILCLSALTVAQDYEDYRPARPAQKFSAVDTKPTPVPILKQINRHNEDGSYTYGYEGADGSFKIETKLATGEVKGKYGYVDESGKVRIVEYGANKFGFQPSGEGITVAPPTLVDETEGKDGYNDYEEAPARFAVRPKPQVCNSHISYRVHWLNVNFFHRPLKLTNQFLSRLSPNQLTLKKDVLSNNILNKNPNITIMNKKSNNPSQSDLHSNPDQNSKLLPNKQLPPQFNRNSNHSKTISILFMHKTHVPLDPNHSLHSLTTVNPKDSQKFLKPVPHLPEQKPSLHRSLLHRLNQK